MSNYIDFFLIDDSDSDDPTLSKERRWTIGDGSVSSVVDLVSTVATKCTASSAKVGTLRISGHGDERGGPIGRDWIDLTTLPQHVVNLMKLNRYFDIRRTEVIFDSCQTGTNIRLLSRLSVIWNGIKVSGFFDDQVPNLLAPRDEGVKFTCSLKMCEATHSGISAKSVIRLPR